MTVRYYGGIVTKVVHIKPDDPHLKGHFRSIANLMEKESSGVYIHPDGLVQIVSDKRGYEIKPSEYYGGTGIRPVIALLEIEKITAKTQKPKEKVNWNPHKKPTPVSASKNL